MAAPRPLLKKKEESAPCPLEAVSLIDLVSQQLKTDDNNIKHELVKHTQRLNQVIKEENIGADLERNYKDKLDLLSVSCSHHLGTDQG